MNFDLRSSVGVLISCVLVTLLAAPPGVQAQQHVVSSTDIPFSVQGKDIILMDDVLYTGRTIRAALDALFDHGRPSRVQLLVLIDRGHRELPIEARFIGRTVQTADAEIIEVKFQEIDDMEKVLLVEKVEAGTGA